MNRIYLSILVILTIVVAYPAQAGPGDDCGGAGSQDGEYGSGGGEDDGSDGAYTQWGIQIVHSVDPNDIVGPKGFVDKQWVSVKDKLKYTIRFENNPQFATAPAQNVFIHLPVEPRLNLNTVQISGFGFGQYHFAVPEGSPFHTARLDVRDSLHLFVDIMAGIDVTKNEVFWIFRSVDPVTGQAPANALAGFLPVNDTSINRFNDTVPKPGEGYVTFLISPKNNLSTGDTVLAKATIIFDINEEIPTNTWVNTIDAVAPESSIRSFLVKKDTITLRWGGQDDVNGTGIREYAFYVSENGENFTLYRKQITADSGRFIGTPGSSYRFFTIATDNVGNQEILKREGEVTVVLIPDVVVPITWLYFKGQPVDNDVLLSWATVLEKNSRSFVIERSLDGRTFTDIGTVFAAGTSYQTSNYSYTDRDVLFLDTKTLYYRLRQIDLDGKYAHSVVVAIPVKRMTTDVIVKAYPNPFTQHITLQFVNVTGTNQSDNVTLYTLDGKLLYTRKIVNRGNSTVLLNDLPMLGQGVYMLKARINGKQYTFKMIRQ